MGISAQDHAREIGNLLDKQRAEVERLRSELVLIRAMAEDASRPDCMNVNAPITRILLACERALQTKDCDHEVDPFDPLTETPVCIHCGRNPLEKGFGRPEDKAETGKIPEQTIDFQEDTESVTVRLADGPSDLELGDFDVTVNDTSPEKAFHSPVKDNDYDYCEKCGEFCSEHYELCICCKQPALTEKDTNNG